MRKALKYLQKEASMGYAPTTPPAEIRPHPLRGIDSASGDPPAYILVKIQSNSTRPGEVLPEFGVGDLAHRSVLDKHQAAANAVMPPGWRSISMPPSRSCRAMTFTSRICVRG